MSKTETQSEALKLAGLLWSGPRRQADALIAAELRRLDAEVGELKMTVQHESLCVEAAKERIKALDAENKALRERLEIDPWQPIEMAPKDGTEVLCWREDCGPFIAKYTSVDSFPLTQAEIDGMDEESLFHKDWFTQWPQAFRLDGGEAPTHWMPLPAAPGDGTAHFSAQQEPLCWVFEDELPRSMTQDAYNALYPHSRVDTVRMFPIFGPAAAKNGGAA